MMSTSFGSQDDQDGKISELTILDDDLLKQVIELLPVENQFLLIRACRRLSRLVYDEEKCSGTLTGVKRISGITELLCVGNRYILRAFRKMPNLVSIHCDGRGLNYGLEDDVLIKIAKTNSNLKYFGDWTHLTIIRYIKMVKKWNVKYDESQIKQLFPVECPIGDLKLKLQWDAMHSDPVKPEVANLISDVQIRFFLCLPAYPLTSVTSINLYRLNNLADNNGQVLENIFDFFPKLKVVEIMESESFPKINPRIFFRTCLSLKLLEDVTFVSAASTRAELSSPEWNQEDTDIFEQLLMKTTMKNIVLNEVCEKSEHLIVRAFMNCPPKRFRNFKINDTFHYDGSSIVIKGYPQFPMANILSKFGDVNLVELMVKRKVPAHAEGVKRAVKECQEYSNRHKRKQFRLQIATLRAVVHSFDF